MPYDIGAPDQPQCPVVRLILIDMALLHGYKLYLLHGFIDICYHGDTARYLSAFIGPTLNYINLYSLQ